MVLAKYFANLWFNVCSMLVSCLINVMCITYSVLSRKLASNFPIFILSEKNGQSLWSLCNFSRYWTSISRKYHLSVSSLWFFMKFSLNWEVSFTSQNYLLEAFATLPNHIDYLHPNIEDMAILYSYHNLSFICY